ncbi:alanine--tRNA ligase [Longirhabdus pacifica]|uniref:alanine--tRNA ligase n=1 Tax=Longirhabdus pacifica TaxID=2305227 RepID=UPI001008F89D|nr:alanine--tRNA ligase [Longirhabdus pacifica]
MKSSEIRQKWLEFFATKGHKIEPSAPLVPHNDPSLLWINAGMAPLKLYFDGSIIPDNPRIANAQKCIRTNDIENVGKTKRHQTFFEMLGNFSIGDYFKEETISWAWEFLTDKKWIGFDKDLLSVTIHEEDDEAFAIWNEKIGLPKERIVRLREGNFWEIGEGPCGPCSEIFYDRGEAFGDTSDPECYPGGENERYLEVWNLVFTQYNKNKDGSYTPLPKKNIDTGAGLERFASILQHVESNFDTDLFQPIIQKTCRIADVTYGKDVQVDTALKVIADHVRTVIFAVADDVLPSNEGRGYVIRRLLRRAVRYGKILGIDRPFMFELVDVVADIMGVYYTNVKEKVEIIEKVIKTEEERFHETLSDGLDILSQIELKAKQEGRTQITGEEAFKLYDTYGFPLDLTEDYAVENEMTVDRDGFDKAMDKQRERARAARQDTGSMKIQGGPLADFSEESKFTGYETLTTSAKVLAILHDDQLLEEAKEGMNVYVILDQTPFYAESGGQVSDHGTLSAEGVQATVSDVFKAPKGQHVHHVSLEHGSITVGDTLHAEVDRSNREGIIKNHTATHLLHQALKETLGDHVNQAGSLVAVDRLRFDFSHFGGIEPEQLKQIERKVNEQIWSNTTLSISYKNIDEAKEMGAMALFGEKYGDIVRVVQIGDYSLELCGGCHVTSTGEIGTFKILSEAGIGSGVRRIEAATGQHAYEYNEQQLNILGQVGHQLKTKSSQDVMQRVELLQAQLKELTRENESLKSKLSSIEGASLHEKVTKVNDIPLLTAEIDGQDMDGLRQMADELKVKLQSAIIVLGAVQGEKVNFVAAVTPDLVQKGYHAGKLVKATAQICGGGGGGRPDMAQAGGKDPAKMQEALQAVQQWI